MENKLHTERWKVHDLSNRWNLFIKSRKYRNKNWKIEYCCFCHIHTEMDTGFRKRNVVENCWSQPTLKLSNPDNTRIRQ
jgi:hypothetical protein